MKTKIVLNGIWEDNTVYLDGVRLSPYPSQQLRNHSPDGFSWGYLGSGPAQLALAVLLAAGFSKEQATNKYMQFKEAVISQLPQQDFTVEIDLTEFASDTYHPGFPESKAKVLEMTDAQLYELLDELYGRENLPEEPTHEDLLGEALKQHAREWTVR